MNRNLFNQPEVRDKLAKAVMSTLESRCNEPERFVSVSDIRMYLSANKLYQEFVQEYGSPIRYLDATIQELYQKKQIIRAITGSHTVHYRPNNQVLESSETIR